MLSIMKGMFIQLIDLDPEMNCCTTAMLEKKDRYDSYTMTWKQLMPKT
jgi:hypothetical protein